MYSLIVTAKMNGIEPQAWLTDILAHRRSAGSSAGRAAALELDASVSDLSSSGVTTHVNKVHNLRPMPEAYK